MTKGKVKPSDIFDSISVYGTQHDSSPIGYIETNTEVTIHDEDNTGNNMVHICWTDKSGIVHDGYILNARLDYERT